MEGGEFVRRKIEDLEERMEQMTYPWRYDINADYHIMSGGNVAKHIKDFAIEHDIDLIILDGSGFRHHALFHMSGTALKLMRNAECPVMVLNPDTD